MPEPRPDAGQQFVDPEGLLHIVVRAQVERPDLHGFRIPRRQHQHGRRAPRADGLQQGQAVEVGQPQVQHHQVGRIVGEPAQALRAGPGRDGPIAGGLEGRHQGDVEAGVVLDDQDGGRRGLVGLPTGALAKEGHCTARGRLRRTRAPL